MKVKIDLSYFFINKLNKNHFNLRAFNNNLKKCIDASEKLMSEINNSSNEIINSFSLDYQLSIKKKKISIKNNKNKLVIGLGGSSAGAKAIKSLKDDNNIFFFDNYDPNYIYNFFQKHDLSDFSVYVISKSVNTFETIAMFNLTYKFLSEKFNEEHCRKNIIIITEDSDNLLRNFAKKKNILNIDHNKYIGGRFSVFSETSQILFDFDANIISKNANSPILKLFENDYLDHNNPATNAAIILTLQNTYKYRFNINLLYNYLFKNYSYWYHQLFAESLGKNQLCMTPMSSICPKDHHSMMQLFLDGPKDKFFNIYSPQKNSNLKNFTSLSLGLVEKMTPDTFLYSQFNSVIKTFQNRKIPHRIFNFPENNKSYTDCIFELFSFSILETIILAYAQNINPYNQPAVEEIKNNTFSNS